jgi:hypothetical protein
VHRSRIVRWAGSVGVREGVASVVRMFVGWSLVDFWWYVVVFNRSISVYLEFPVGLVVGVS